MAMTRAMSPSRASGADGLRTPPLKSQKSPFEFEDGCSTVAPSPAPASWMTWSPAPSPDTPWRSSFSPCPSSLPGLSLMTPKAFPNAHLPLSDELPASWAWDMPELPPAVRDDVLDFTMGPFFDAGDRAPFIIPDFGDPPAVKVEARSPFIIPDFGLPPAVKVEALDMDKAFVIASPPSTPRSSTSISPQSTPPGAPRAAPPPPLLAALRMGSLEQVRHAVEKDPQAAASVFLDHDWEPPLCAAVRLGCDAEIIELLITHGADVNAADIHGRTPLTILSSCQPMCNENDLSDSVPLPSAMSSYFQHVQDNAIKQDLRIANVLTESGADPRLPDERGKCPCELALAYGNNHLVELWTRVDTA